MRFVEYNDYYSIELRPEKEAVKNSLLEVDCGKGILVTFGKVGGAKKIEKWMKLFDIGFDKNYYSAQDMYDFWSDHDVRYYTRKGSWGRHIPVADDIIDIGNGEYIAFCWRNTGKKEALCHQIRRLEEGRRPVDVAFGYESPLIPLFASKLDKNISIKSILNGIKEVNTQFKNYDKESILDFGSWFFEMYFEDNSDLHDAIYKKWENGPELFNYIDDIRETNWQNHYIKIYNTLSVSQKEQIDKVIDYVVSLKGNRSIINPDNINDYIRANPKWDSLMNAVLLKIRKELDRLYWNKYQKEMESPFDNTGAEYKNDVFSVRAYNWDDDAEEEPNFEWGPIQVYWYKREGRGNTVYTKIGYDDPAIYGLMLDKCLEALSKDFGEKDDRKDVL